MAKNKYPACFRVLVEDENSGIKRTIGNRKEELKLDPNMFKEDVEGTCAEMAESALHHVTMKLEEKCREQIADALAKDDKDLDHRMKRLKAARDSTTRAR